MLLKLQLHLIPIAKLDSKYERNLHASPSFARMYFKEKVSLNKVKVCGIISQFIAIISLEC